LYITVRKFSECCSCAASNIFSSDPYFFTIEECEVAIVNDKPGIKCPKEGIDIELTQLLPDIFFTDREEFHIDFKDIQIRKKIGEGNVSKCH
jgi:hypothetical protein